jgi:hypothetical protein
MNRNDPPIRHQAPFHVYPARRAASPLSIPVPTRPVMRDEWKPMSPGAFSMFVGGFAFAIAAIVLVAVLSR